MSPPADCQDVDEYDDDYDDDEDDDDDDDDDDDLQNDQDLLIVLSAKDFLGGGNSNEDPHDIPLFHSTSRSHTNYKRESNQTKYAKKQHHPTGGMPLLRHLISHESILS